MIYKKLKTINEVTAVDQLQVLEFRLVNAIKPVLAKYKVEEKGIQTFLTALAALSEKPDFKSNLIRFFETYTKVADASQKDKKL